jgi:hypothetical protein
VQVAPMKPTLKPPGTEPLKLESDGQLSSFAFRFKSLRFTEGLHYVLEETVLALLRNPEYCVYGTAPTASTTSTTSSTSTASTASTASSAQPTQPPQPRQPPQPPQLPPATPVPS